MRGGIPDLGEGKGKGGRGGKEKREAETEPVHVSTASLRGKKRGKKKVSFAPSSCRAP